MKCFADILGLGKASTDECERPDICFNSSLLTLGPLLLRALALLVFAFLIVNWNNY